MLRQCIKPNTVSAYLEFSLGLVWFWADARNLGSTLTTQALLNIGNLPTPPEPVHRFRLFLADLALRTYGVVHERLKRRLVGLVPGCVQASGSSPSLAADASDGTYPQVSACGALVDLAMHRQAFGRNMSTLPCLLLHCAACQSRHVSHTSKQHIPFLKHVFWWWMTALAHVGGAVSLPHILAPCHASWTNPMLQRRMRRASRAAPLGAAPMPSRRGPGSCTCWMPRSRRSGTRVSQPRFHVHCCPICSALWTWRCSTSCYSGQVRAKDVCPCLCVLACSLIY